jgi:hypothetical protein
MQRILDRGQPGDDSEGHEQGVVNQAKNELGSPQRRRQAAGPQ